MNFLQSIIMGFVQGLTEFLPVSSSAHLNFANYFLNTHLDESTELSFHVLLHLATLLAVLIYFRHDVRELIKGLGKLIISPVRNYKNDFYSRLVVFLIIATIPAGIVGIVLRKTVEEVLVNPLISALLLLVTAVMLIYISGYKKIAGNESGALEKMTLKGAFIVGLMQAVAILPGISRSGSTIFAGLRFAGLSRESAPRFAFLLSIPIILAGGLLDLKKLIAEKSSVQIDYAVLSVGFLVAFISGYAAIVLLLNLVKRGKLSYFGYYCLVVGLGLSIYFLFYA